MNARLTPQMRMILNHVKRAGHITGRSALIDYGIAALPRRIADLSEMGYGVTTERCQHPATGQRYVRYYIKSPAELAAEAKTRAA